MTSNETEFFDADPRRRPKVGYFRPAFVNPVKRTIAGLDRQFFEAPYRTLINFETSSSENCRASETRYKSVKT
jgi:hypothetical protein